MQKFSVRFDPEYREFLVVRWDNPCTPVAGRIVYRTFNMDDASDWAQCAVQQENADIFNEFG